MQMQTSVQIFVLRAAVAVLLITHNCRDAAAKNKGRRHSARHNAGRWTAEPKAPREAPAVAESGGRATVLTRRAALPLRDSRWGWLGRSSDASDDISSSAADVTE